MIIEFSDASRVYVYSMHVVIKLVMASH